MAGACGGGHSILQEPLGSYSSHVCASSFHISSLAGADAVQVPFLNSSTDDEFKKVYWLMKGYCWKRQHYNLSMVAKVSYQLC